jgi:ABC-2 type transport system ATP-binding protein
MVEADRLCDRIAIVDHGKIIALDTPRGLRTLLPAEAGLQLALEGGEEDPSALFEALEWVQRVDTQHTSGRWDLKLYGESDTAAAQALAIADRPVIELRRIEGTLEDIFVHLTGHDLR